MTAHPSHSSGVDGQETGGSAPRLRSFPLLPVLAVLSPSLLLFLFPVYEEDVATHVFCGPWGWQAWLEQGRPFWFLIERLTVGRFHYPSACYPLAFVYTLLYAAFLLQLVWLFRRLLPSSRLAWMVAALIGLHFHFSEGRLWNGHFMLAAANMQMAGLLLALRCADRPGVRWWTLAVPTCLLGWLALNTHQAGAFVMPSLLAMGCASLLLREGGGKAGWRAWLWAGVGFFAACVLYAVEILLVAKAIGLSARASAVDPAASLLGLLRSVGVTAVSPGPWATNAAPWACAGAFLLLAILLVAKPSGTRLRRRLWAVLAIALGSLAAGVPGVMTDGYWSSRGLIPVLIGVWGGGAVFLFSGLRMSESAARRLLLVLLGVMWLLHLLGFGVVVAIKAEDKRWVERLHAELGDLDVVWGDGIDLYSESYFSPRTGWGDYGRSLFATPWGPHYLLWPGSFDSSDLPEEVRDVLVTDREMPRETVRSGAPRFVTRLADGRIAVDCRMVFTRQLEIEDRFFSPWDGRTTFALGELARLGLTVRKGEFLNGWAAGNSLSMHAPPPGGKHRTFLRTVRLDRSWTLKTRLALPHPDASPVQVRVGLRGPDGADRLLKRLSLKGGDENVRLKVEGPASPGAMLWIEVRLTPDAKNNWWSETQWTRGRLVLESSKQ